MEAGKNRMMLMVMLMASCFPLGASGADGPPVQGNAEAQEPIYGSQLMTPEERIAHRQKMRSLQSDEARQQYRIEHHRQMQERAKERGMILPDSPPHPGMGYGPGMGQGMGPGPGGAGGPGPRGPGR